MKPVDLPLVMDADSSQTAAIVTALRGRSFVLQGPPGTGKSQTIVNLIASALARGKTVLFVSEKMEALNVVYRRLQGVGLSDFCLELHSHKAQKRQVVKALGRTLERGERTKRPSWEDSSTTLEDLRSRLNAYVRAIHAPTSLGHSFHEASAHLIALADAPLISMRVPDLGGLAYPKLRRALDSAGEFALAASDVEPVSAHPFANCAVDGWSSQLDQEVREVIARATASTKALGAAGAELRALLAVDDALSLASLAKLAELTGTVSSGPVPGEWRDDAAWTSLRERVASWKDAREDQARRRADLARRWRDEVYGTELAELEPLFARWATAFFLFAWIFLFGARRKLAAIVASSLPGNRQIAADLGLARKANDSDITIAEAHRALRRAFEGCGAVDTPVDLEAVLVRGEALRNATRRASTRAAFPVERAIALADARASTDDERREAAAKAKGVLSALQEHGEAVGRLHSVLALREGTWPSDDLSYLDAASQLLARWADRFEQFRPWCLYRRRRRELEDQGLVALADTHASGAVRGSDCVRALERTLLEAWVATTRDANLVLRDFDGKHHHALVERFRYADTTHIEDARAHIAGCLEERLPRRGAEVASESEPGILRRELAKKTRHMPLRKLLGQIPNLLVRLKPCLLMSPLSVAQYLPARGRKFDLVIFDEASQICTHDAIGAIGRGSQVVVVGDSRQLPPTAFFQRASAADDELPDDNDFTELESVLDEAIASGLPEQMLNWHYRSRHEALIEFSNQRYYDNRLHVFPAARGRVEDLGVKFHRVKDGVYEVGKSRTNPKEAEAVVAVVVGLLRKTSPADRSFGIVTFSAPQKEKIDDLLDEARAKFPEIETHFSDDHPTHEPVFVKNLENVQGDERDEIFFSVAYGPDENGKLLMNFGPLNRDGGERRLNVAVTRARRQLRVFSSMTAESIDENRTRGMGPKHLKAFLRFAAERSLSNIPRSDERPGDFDSDFERDVYDFVRANGYRVDTQVGCGGYRIDLAVVHPEQPGVYALGIECDGAAYHSGATARDRDRLRQQILEGLGWHLHRIWSTDWIYGRQKEGERLLEAIDRAVREGPRDAHVPALTAPPPEPSSSTVLEAPADDGAPPECVQDEDSPVVPYRRAELAVVSGDPEAMYHATRGAQLRDLVAEVIRVEAPIHVDELTRRVGAAFGVQRVSTRARRRILEVLKLMSSHTVTDEFVWAAGASRSYEIEVRVDKNRDPETVPPEEVASAARWVLSKAYSMPINDLVRETARVFGIQRLGTRVDARVRQGIELLVQSKVCARDGERAVWKGDAGIGKS